MSVKSDLLALNEALPAVLDGCNENLMQPVSVLTDLPAAVQYTRSESHEQGIRNGYAAGESAGYESGFARGLDVGAAAEQQRVWNETWDKIQLNQNGQPRSDYYQTFSGAYWDDDTFKPKYDIIIRYEAKSFAYSRITDLQAILDRQGVKLIFDKYLINAPSQMFQGSTITRLGVLDCSMCNQVNYFLYDANKLVTVEKLILKTGVKQHNMLTCFQRCYELVNITIEGNITSSTTFADCTKLSRASIESIVASLWDNATSDNTITFSQTAVNAAFTPEAWTALKATKPNWQIEVA